MEGEEGEAKIIKEYVNDFASWGEWDMVFCCRMIDGRARNLHIEHSTFIPAEFGNEYLH